MELENSSNRRGYDEGEGVGTVLEVVLGRPVYLEILEGDRQIQVLVDVAIEQ